MSTHELDLFDFVASTAASMPERLFTEPDDDWTPVAFLEDASGERATVPLEQFMVNDRSKDLLADYILPQVIKKFSATTCVMVLSAWTIKVDPGTNWQDQPRPSEHPERSEILVLIEYTADGVTRYTAAPIIRHEDAPPTLGEWEDQDASLGKEGRFVGPIVKAMKRV